MDKLEFFYKYTSASSEMDMIKRIEIETQSIDPYPIDRGIGNRNLIIVMEECGELIQELTNVQLGIGDRISLIEETADVEQGLDYVKIICVLSDDDIMYDKFADKRDEVMFNKNINPIIALTTLQQQLSKYLRNKHKHDDLCTAVRNVYRALENIRYIYSIDDKEINKAINVKLQRLVETKQSNPEAIYQ